MTHRITSAYVITDVHFTESHSHVPAYIITDVHFVEGHWMWLRGFMLML
jgi:hypothetical protein